MPEFHPAKKSCRSMKSTDRSYTPSDEMEAKRVYELLCLYEEKQTWEQYLARITQISEKLPSQ